MKTTTLAKLASAALFASVFAALSAYAGEEDQAPSRKVVAISKFENKSGAPDSLFRTIRARVQQCIAGSRKYEVVEREQLKTAMSEQQLAASGATDTDDSNAPDEGKMKAASYVIYGNVLYCDKEGADGSFDGVASSVVKYKVELQIKITDGETGKNLAIKSAIGYGIDKATATAEYRSSTGQGLRDAIDEACHMAADALRDISYPAKVIKVGKKDITINMTDEEVKEGDVFDVIEADDFMTDPDTGAPLGYDGDDVGRVVITRTGPMVSKARPVEGGELALKDLGINEHTYILRRVSKATLKNEAKKAARKRNASFESRF